MSVTEVGRSEAEVMDQLARSAAIRRLSILQEGLTLRPIPAYVVEALNLMLSARTVLAAASADQAAQKIPSGVSEHEFYVRQGDWVSVGARRRPAGVR
jgi:hypothetical protein